MHSKVLVHRLLLVDVHPHRRGHVAINKPPCDVRCGDRAEPLADLFVDGGAHAGERVDGVGAAGRWAVVEEEEELLVGGEVGGGLLRVEAPA